MNKRIYLWLVVVIAFAGTTALHAQTPENHTGLTAEMRWAFLADQESKLRATAHVSADFWIWLNDHQQIREGLLTSADPVPAVYAENMDYLRHALGVPKAQKYAQLMLGVSLGPRLDSAQAWGADGAYNASEVVASAKTPVDPRLTSVADYLKQQNMTVAEFVPQADAIMKKLQLAALKPADRDSFFNYLAYMTGTYPQRQPFGVADCLLKLIGRYETTLPPFTDKGPQWPLFPLDRAPFPMLAPLRQTLPERELDYLWNRFNGKFGGKRLYGYGIYSWNYVKPDVEYKISAWNPTSLPRIIEDGGVCGRLSTLAQLSDVGLGKPAVGMYQPGHRALISYNFNPKSDEYSAVPEQGITGPVQSTAQWFLPVPMGQRVSSNGRTTGIEYQFALALSMNIGLDRYMDSRVAYLLANRLDSAASALALLQSATDLNPYNLEAWYAQANLIGDNTTACNQLTTRLSTLMFAPDAGLPQEENLDPNMDLSQHVASEQPASLRRQSNVVASIVSDQIMLEVYGAALKDRADAQKNRANLLVEWNRRAKIKLPCGIPVDGLVYQFDVVVDGATAVEEKVAGEIQLAANAKSNNQQTQAIETHISAVLEEIPAPAARVTWLKSLYGEYPVARRFQLDNNGHAADQVLYSYLQQQLFNELNSMGKVGVAEKRVLAANYQAALTAFEESSKN